MRGIPFLSHFARTRDGIRQRFSSKNLKNTFETKFSKKLFFKSLAQLRGAILAAEFVKSTRRNMARLMLRRDVSRKIQKCRFPKISKTRVQKFFGNF